MMRLIFILILISDKRPKYFGVVINNKTLKIITTLIKYYNFQWYIHSLQGKSGIYAPFTSKCAFQREVNLYGKVQRALVY